MQMKKVGAAILVVWVWLLIWDNLLAGLVAGPALAQIPGMSESFSKAWETIGDLFVAGVLVWVYDKVKASFSAGPKGGMTFGLYVGILANFPGWLWMTVYADWPYAATWMLIVIMTLLTVVSGTLVGLVYDKVGGTRTG